MVNSKGHPTSKSRYIQNLLEKVKWIEYKHRMEGVWLESKWENVRLDQENFATVKRKGKESETRGVEIESKYK